jgi:tRNA threonylcarbamoyladenosine biosynthesis protein TsaE
MPVTDGPDETAACGAALAAGLFPGDVVLISGDLGAGKTTFVRGALRALGVRGPVTSPTFTIGQLHDDGRIGVAHLDLYRVGDLRNEDPSLLEDFLTPDRVAFVEWPAVGEAAFTRVRHRVTIEHAGADRRRIEISP